MSCERGKKSCLWELCPLSVGAFSLPSLLASPHWRPLLLLTLQHSSLSSSATVYLHYWFELLTEVSANGYPLVLTRPPAEPTLAVRRAATGQHDGGQRAPGARRGLRVRQHGGRQVPRGGEDGGAQRLLQSHCQGLLVKVLDYFSVFFCFSCVNVLLKNRAVELMHPL